nr:uracil-DNA glycosylase [Nocardia stercoris]
MDAHLIDCRACPRLVAWREEVATVKRPGFRDWEYWARPVPGFGPADAPVLLVGLAPAANGGNRTGRMFTGDPSGDLLFATLHELGVASQPTSIDRGDGLELCGVRITAAVHCAPPDNRPTTAERDRCRTWLARELELLDPGPVAVGVLGGFAWQALLPVLAATGWRLPAPRPTFGHGMEVILTQPLSGRQLRVFGSYHPSRRNISTRIVTPAMLREVLRRVLVAGGVVSE